MRVTLLILASILLCGNLSANEPPRQVSGCVTDEKGETLPYATILIKGTTYGTASDVNGRYLLEVKQPGSYSLLVRYAGFTQHEQQVFLNRDTVIDFRLKEDALNLNEVTVTATRTPKLLKDAPVITRVITTEDIRRINAVTVQDLLQTELPGLEFTREMDGQTSIHMQGMSGKYILFLVDGERMAGETLNNVDYNRLNASEIERVEIVRGGASALYGSNAIGGVVNIITKNANKPFSANVYGNYGLWKGSDKEDKTLHEQRYGTTIGLKQDKVSSLTTFNYKQKSSYLLIDADGTSQPVNGGNDYNVSEKLSWRVNEKMTLTGKGGLYFRDVDNRDAGYAEQKVKDRYRNYNGSLRMNYNITAEQNLEASYLLDRYNKYDRYTVRGVDSLNYRNTQHTARLQYTNAFGKGNTLTGGAEFFRDELMSYQFDGNVHSTNDYILFAQHDFDITKKLNVVYGVRMDYYNSFGAHFSPSLSLMYKLNPVTFRGAYSRGFRAPSLKEMYTNWDMGGMGWFQIIGDPNLKPELSNNFSLSAEYSRDRVNLSVIGYYNDINRKITTVYNSEAREAVYTNVDNSGIGGLDVNLAVKCPLGFTVKTAYTYVHEKLEQNGINVSSTRPHSATLGVNYEFSLKNYFLNVALNGRFMGKLDTNEATDTMGTDYVPVHYPSYQMWRLVVSQRFCRAYTLQLSVDNLLNYKPGTYAANSPVSTGATFTAGISIDIDEIF